MKRQIRKQAVRGHGRHKSAILAIVLSLAVASGCDTLLDVQLPAQLTDDALTNPGSATTYINSVIAQFEDAYDFHTYRTFGREDAGEVYLCGPMCDVSNYVTVYNHFTPFSKSLWFGRQLRAKLETDWTAQQVPQRDRFLATISLYEGATLSVYGTNLCEVTIDSGPLLKPEQALDMAEASLTRALSEIQTAGDFALQNNIASSARSMAYGLRAQVRWFKGDKAGALADAQQVPAGFVARVTRDPGEARQNRGWTSGTNGGFFELYDPIDWWSGLPNPVTGATWPTVIPFTGYTYLGILPDGRAVHDNGVPVRTRGGWHNAHGVAAGAVADTRVTHRTTQIQGKQAEGEVSTKYSGEASPINLVNWKEMVLIRAELEGGQKAIDLVNELRTADRLPLVTYANPSNAAQIRYMVIEERRRALFNEARFFYTKLKNMDVLWFPRDNGGTRFRKRPLLGGIRYVMPNDEYVANPNLSPAMKATGCAPFERPINPL